MPVPSCGPHVTTNRKGRRIVAKIRTQQETARIDELLSADEKQMLAHALVRFVASIVSLKGEASFGVCRTCRYCQKEADAAYLCRLLSIKLTAADTERICRA